MRPVPHTKLSTSNFMFPRDRPLAVLRAALSIWNSLFRFALISLSRYLLSGSSFGSPGVPLGGRAAFQLFLVKLEVLGGTSAPKALTGCGEGAD